MTLTQGKSGAEPAFRRTCKPLMNAIAIASIEIASLWEACRQGLSRRHFADRSNRQLPEGCGAKSAAEFCTIAAYGRSFWKSWYNVRPKKGCRLTR